MAGVSAGQLGYWFGGFILTMTVSYVLLRIAGSAKRKPSTAIVLRVLAVAIAVFLAYAGAYAGDLNAGAVVAAVIITAWAINQQITHKSAST